jgi:hypothetical protein
MRAMVQQTLDRMIAVGIGCDMTKRIVRSDGELRVIRYLGVPVVENDIVTRFIGTLTEITEQETATQKLRLSPGIASKRRRSVKPAASAGIYRAENWFARTRLCESLRTLEA